MLDDASCGGFFVIDYVCRLPSSCAGATMAAPLQGQNSARKFLYALLCRWRLSTGWYGTRELESVIFSNNSAK